MYHLELRQFPHSLWRFNLTEAQLRVIAEPWAREQWVELGERKWSPHQAKLTILEGPQLPMQELSMGRGWRNAQRRSQDVTERVLATLEKARRQEPGAVSHAPAPKSSSAPGLLADSLGLELLSLLDHAPAPLARAWRLAHERFPDRSPSECLALAEQAISSLLQRRLIVLLASTADTPDAPKVDGEAGELVVGEAIEPALRDLDSWAAELRSGAIRMRRA